MKERIFVLTLKIAIGVLSIYVVVLGLEILGLKSVSKNYLPKIIEYTMTGKVSEDFQFQFNYPRVKFTNIKKFIKEKAGNVVWENDKTKNIKDNTSDTEDNSTEAENNTEADNSDISDAKYITVGSKDDGLIVVSSTDVSGEARETYVDDIADEQVSLLNSIKTTDDIEKTLINNLPLTGTVYAKSKLSDFEFIKDTFYTVSSNTYLKESDFGDTAVYDVDLTVEKDSSVPQILIYHTHSQELYADSNNINEGVIGMGNYLTQILEDVYGYNVIHDTTCYDKVNGILDRDKAYDYARDGISEILEENPTIEVVLDLHRDGVNENVSLVTEVNGKSTAKIMFFNGISRLKDIGDLTGISNPYKSTNLALSLNMKLKAEAYYPGLTRNNYINAYKYNQDLCPKSMLIEVGAQNNTYEQACNAMEPLAVLLNMTLQGQ